MKTINISLLFFLILLSFAGCRKDSSTSEIIQIPNDPEINIETTLNGFITDRNGVAIPDAEVNILNASTQTNEYGFFEITGLVNEKFAIIKVEKTGFFNQYKTIIPSKTATNKTRIQLTEKGAPETVSSNSGGQVSIGQNSTVQFQSNCFIDEQGNSYNGNVNVYSFYIDPTDSNVDQFMPGNMMARNTENDLQVLESFGMVNVELEGEAGQKLNINKPATLEVEVPNSIANNAPTEIPLWYFEEEKGLWIEEGNAVLQNGKYSGEVEHFTFWNCDVAIDWTYIEGQVAYFEGVPNVKIRVTNLTTNATVTDWVDGDGFFDGYVPQNTTLLLEILDDCGDELFSDNIGPFTTSEEFIGIINLVPNNDFILVSGQLVGCNAAPISNGQVLFSANGITFTQQTTTNSNGEFSTVINSCSTNDIHVVGMDLDNFTLSDVDVVTPSPNLDLGELLVCGAQFSEGVIISYDGNTKLISDMNFQKITDVPGVIQYQFVFQDFSYGESIEYFWRFNDNNVDLTNPDWSYQMSNSVPGVLNGHEAFSLKNLDYATITVLQEAINPGDLMTIKVTDVIIERIFYENNGNVTATSYPNGVAIVTGKLP